MRKPERDRAVERGIRASAAGAADGAGACLDPGVMAAYAEHMLTRAEQAACEAHLSRCAHCQEQLAWVIRTMPAPDPAAARTWMQVIRSRWIPLMAGSAAVLTLATWLAVREVHEPGATSYDAVDKTAPQAVGPSAAPETSVAESRDAASLSRQVGQRGAPAAAPPRQGTTVARSPQKERFRNMASARDNRADETPLREKATADSERDEVTVTVAAEAPSAPPPPPAPSQPAPPVAAPAEQAQERSAAAKAAEPAAPQSPERLAETVTILPDASARRVERRGMALTLAEKEKVIDAPGGHIRYMLRDREIFRSTDGGATQTLEVKDAGATLLAGMAPDAEVCWAVGQQGAVWRRDSGGWRSVPLRDRLTLTSVVAIDANSARVTAADGRVFETTDGGVNWRPVR